MDSEQSPTVCRIGKTVKKRTRMYVVEKVHLCEGLLLQRSFFEMSKYMHKQINKQAGAELSQAQP